ncbi:bpX6 domain-containing protein [Kitasatospora sp. NPDC088134]|uniref:bpX6 domain-containing protein n=1 Tax=Kitasatospora sp. NPDC088134 TaxID=3364071 RepID=UPI00382DEC7F
MTATAAGRHRASVDAAGFVLDAPLLGADEAASRALRYWQDGARLTELPCGSWLLQLAEPVSGRADRGPGLPVLARSGRLVSLDLPDGDTGEDENENEGGGAEVAGYLVRLHHGVRERHRLADLPPVPLVHRLDLGNLTVRHLTSLAREPEPEPVVEALLEVPRPDLRAAARVRPASERAVRARSTDPGAARDRGVRPGSLRTAGLAVLLLALGWKSASLFGASTGPALAIAAVYAVLTMTAAGLAAARRARAVAPTDGTAATPGARPARGTAPGTRPGLFHRLARLARLRRPSRTTSRAHGTDRTRGTGRTRTARPARPRLAALTGLLSALALRTPADRLIRGRHVRYLNDLTGAFRRRDWDEALREAMALGGERGPDGPSWLSLALPRRRTGPLRPSPAQGSTGAFSALSGPTVHQHLTELYRNAAEALEREGRIDEAAFVLADLLTAPAEAVALLERQRRYADAAALAEGRGLDAELAVRLWWRAGERDRAVRLAERHAAFAVAVRRLAEVVPDEALRLREAWVRSRQAAGDRMGAVEAAWPEERLRPLVVGDLRDAVALGGTVRARAFAHLLALGAGAACAPPVRAILAGTEPELADQRAELALSISRLPGLDPVLDREVATAAARAVVRDGGFGPDLDARSGREAFRSLLERADPLAAADLRPPAARPAPGPLGTVTADGLPGRLRLSDAVALESGGVLVACGQAGVRLLGANGRTRARWDVPADRLVVADHGGTVLLVARYGRARELSRLDLATRTVRPWTVLRGGEPLPSFDGRLLTVVEDRALTVYDTHADRPTVLWRELGSGTVLLAPPARTPGSTAALVATGALFERWRWDQPDWQLRSRLRVVDPEPSSAVLADGSVLVLEPDGHRWTLARTNENGTFRRPLPASTEEPVLLADGDLCAVALAAPDGSTTVQLARGTGLDVLAQLRFPAAEPADLALRHHPGTATVRHRDGRLLALTDDGTRLLANLRLTEG